MSAPADEPRSTGLEARLRLELPGGAGALAVALDVDPGRVVVIAGASGAGKTTLLRALAGLREVREGTVRCAGSTWVDVRRGIEVPARDRGIGYLAQSTLLLPRRRAWSDVAFGLGGPWRTRQRRARAELEGVGLAEAADRRASVLSGGQRRRVALARALGAARGALLLDEPFAGLDPQTRERAAARIAAVARQRAVPAVVVSHEPADAQRLGGSRRVLRDGALHPPS